jgi:hypothetical protein
MILDGGATDGQADPPSVLDINVHSAPFDDVSACVG